MTLPIDINTGFPDNLPRCAWAAADSRMTTYHDTEWGIPLHDDRSLFELLILEGAQAGLSWRTILARRPAYRRAFEGFAPEQVAGYGPDLIERLLADPGIIRNRLKVTAAVRNARRFLAVREEFGSFNAYLWGFIGGEPRVNRWERMAEVPALTHESTAMSCDLKKRGFSFVGPTICYAFMQAAGMVNDHLLGCHRHPDYAGER